MAHVYEGAYVTLAAGASIDDDGGFFSEFRSNIDLPSLELNVGGIIHHLQFRFTPEHPDGFVTRNRRFPLMKRAWCFQERLHSRRFLCFGSEEILWECMEEAACPCSMDVDRLFNIRNSADQPTFRESFPTKAYSQNSLYERSWSWRELVFIYSQLNLTYHGDKLPALEGLAAGFKVCHISTGRSQLMTIWRRII